MHGFLLLIIVKHPSPSTYPLMKCLINFLLENILVSGNFKISDFLGTQPISSSLSLRYLFVNVNLHLKWSNLTLFSQLVNFLNFSKCRVSDACSPHVQKPCWDARLLIKAKWWSECPLVVANRGMARVSLGG